MELNILNLSFIFKLIVVHPDLKMMFKEVSLHLVIWLISGLYNIELIVTEPSLAVEVFHNTGMSNLDAGGRYGLSWDTMNLSQILW